MSGETACRPREAGLSPGTSGRLQGRQGDFQRRRAGMPGDVAALRGGGLTFQEGGAPSEGGSPLYGEARRFLRTAARRSWTGRPPFAEATRRPRRARRFLVFPDSKIVQALPHIRVIYLFP